MINIHQRFLHTLPSLATVFYLLSSMALAQSSTSRASIATDGSEAGRPSQRPEISDDGKHVTFRTDAYNLSNGDNNGRPDIAVHHLLTGATEYVSLTINGATGLGDSENASIDATGNFIAFDSTAPDLVTNDSYSQQNVFVRNISLGITERISHGMSGQPNSSSSLPSISGDGRFIAYQSWASNLVTNDLNGWQDVFLYDRQLGTTVCLNVDSTGVPANGFGVDAAISQDGNFVTFVSSANNLVANDTNGVPDIFLYDRVAGTLELISQHSSGQQGNSTSSLPDISADGRFVTFASLSNNLVANDQNGSADIFVRDCLNGTTERVSISSSGIEADSSSFEPSISTDGNFIAFRSKANNLIPLDTNLYSNLFRHDRANGITKIISIDSVDLQANHICSWPNISSDGRLIAFQSAATNLVASDTNAVDDIFLYDDGPALNTIALSGPSSVNAGGNVSYSWSDAPANAPHALLFSFSNSGSILRRHSYDLGPSIHVAFSGQSSSSGSGNYSGTIPLSFAGTTVFLEVGATESDLYYDSNPIALTVL